MQQLRGLPTSRFGKNVMRLFTKVNFGISTVALAQGVMLKGVLLGKGDWFFVFWVGVGREVVFCLMG